MVVDGKEHNLGTLKELIDSPAVAQFMPKDCRVAIAWVRLDEDEVLAIHTHPVDSMILVCEGHGRSIGDLECELSDGDAVLVPAGNPHGFVGSGPNGFWGLSLQFESRGLYEDLDDPWASFEVIQGAGGDSSSLEALLEQCAWHAERFSKHRLFTLAERKRLEEPSARDRFLDCLAVWSSYFQRTLHARACLATDPRYLQLAQKHLEDELGHERTLGTRRQIWDPVLDSIGGWFVLQTMMANDVQRVVMIHLVLEKAAEIFYSRMAKFSFGDAAEHFEQHESVDDKHVEMGIELMRSAGPKHFEELLELQKRSWDMMYTLLTRITSLTFDRAR